MAGRSHPSGGPTRPLDGRSIVALDSVSAEVVQRTTCVVVVVAILWWFGWKLETPLC